MRREERVTVQGPVKEQQPDGMSHRGGGGIAQVAVPCEIQRSRPHRFLKLSRGLLCSTSPVLWSPHCVLEPDSRGCARESRGGGGVSKILLPIGKTPRRGRGGGTVNQSLS